MNTKFKVGDKVMGTGELYYEVIEVKTEEHLVFKGFPGNSFPAKYYEKVFEPKIKKGDLLLWRSDPKDSTYRVAVTDSYMENGGEFVKVSYKDSNTIVTWPADTFRESSAKWSPKFRKGDVIKGIHSKVNATVLKDSEITGSGEMVHLQFEDKSCGWHLVNNFEKVPFVPKFRKGDLLDWKNGPDGILRVVEKDSYMRDGIEYVLFQYKGGISIIPFEASLWQKVPFKPTLYKGDVVLYQGSFYTLYYDSYLDLADLKEYVTIGFETVAISKLKKYVEA